MLARNPSELEGLIDAVVANASACIQNDIFLKAVKWDGVDAAKVAALLERLQGDGTAVPPWLAQALLAGGHVLPGAICDGLGTAFRALNVINGHAAGQQGSDDIEAAARDLAVEEDLDEALLTTAVRHLAKAGHGPLAVSLALAHWGTAPQTLHTLKDDLDAFLADCQDARIRVAGFSTTHTLAQDLGPAFASHGFKADIAEADFGQVIAELMQPVDQPGDAYVLLMDLGGFCPRDWRLEAPRASELFQERLEMFASALVGFADRAERPILVNTLPAPAAPALGLIDRQHESGLAGAVQMVNRRLSELASASAQIVLVDADVAMADIAPSRRTDAKLWYYGRLPYSPDATRALALGFAGAYRTLKKGVAKVLALDLDNTLWGGIYGEDGVERLACGDDFPGNAFKALQEECLRLKSQGMVLAILSKNNPDAITAFEQHPGMVLNADDFVATRINWEPKPHNVRAVAEELNLGLDSVLFLDDSPHEREAMRRLCPEVQVPELPADPAQRPGWLRRLALTWPVRLTSEDARRSAMYMAEKKRTSARATAQSFEDYLGALEQQLTVAQVGPDTLPRVAQMHLRTNQFNLTTERYDEAAIGRMMEDGERYVVLHGRASDKFGDHGIVICATARLDGDGADLQSLLMSCRVVGREVETAFLAELLRYLGTRGVQRVDAAYRPTAKNQMVRDFYERHGFRSAGSDGETSLWSCDLDGEGAPARSNHIDVAWDE